jgi:hypothetical protein
VATVNRRVRARVKGKDKAKARVKARARGRVRDKVRVKARDKAKVKAKVRVKARATEINPVTAAAEVANKPDVAGHYPLAGIRPHSIRNSRRRRFR